MQQLSEARAVKGLLQESREELAMGTSASLTPWVCTHPWSHCLSTLDTAEERGAPGLAPGLRLGQHRLVQPLLHACGQNLSLG